MAHFVCSGGLKILVKVFETVKEKRINLIRQEDSPGSPVGRRSILSHVIDCMKKFDIER